MAATDYRSLDATEALVEAIDEVFHAGDYGSCLAMLAEHRGGLVDESPILGYERWFLLRRGQSLHELGRADEAKKNLQAAFRLGGSRLFDGEDRRYLDLIEPFVKRRLRRYKIASALALLTLPAFLVLMFVLKSWGVDRETLTSWRTFGPMFVVFVSLLLTAAYNSPYSADGESSETDDDGESGADD